MVDQGVLMHTSDGYALLPDASAVSVSHPPIGLKGNGNGKQEQESQRRGHPISYRANITIK
jgi:hypothetical protein